MFERFFKVRANRPAQTRSKREIATWAVARDLRNVFAEPVALDWPDWLFNVGTISGRVLCNAGNNPKASPVNSDRMKQNASTRRSRVGVKTDCMPLDSGSAMM